VLKELNYKYEIIFFGDGELARNYTSTGMEPFIIFSDINMPKVNGIKLQKFMKMKI
jgi:YesN/AraC family two-component response regulator